MRALQAPWRIQPSGSRREAKCTCSSVSPSAIEAENLRVAVHGGEEILKGVDVSVPRGSLYMLVGPNGCGKSTLLRALMGFVETAGGRCKVEEPSALIFQNPDHQVVMPSVASDVAFGLWGSGMAAGTIQETVTRCLDMVGLGGMEERRVSTLSGGQKQRLALAGALVKEPKTLLLDEMTSFLDREDQTTALRTVRKIVDCGATALWVTHRLEELAECDAAAAMHNGRIIVSNGSSSDVVRAFDRRGIGPPHWLRRRLRSQPS